jgi:hypothetical protein
MSAAIEGWRALMMSCDNCGATTDDEKREIIFDAHTDYYNDSKTWIGKFTAVGCATDARTATMNGFQDAKCRCGYWAPHEGTGYGHDFITTLPLTETNGAKHKMGWWLGW